MLSITPTPPVLKGSSDQNYCYRGLCRFILRDMIFLFSLRVARGKWQEAGATAQKAATLCGQLFDALNAEGYFYEGVLFRRSEWGVNLAKAIFFEQAAFCFTLQPGRPRFRMFAVNLTLAADAYNRAGQYEHALGCYFCALPTYKNRRWLPLEDHLFSSMVQTTFSLGLIDHSSILSAKLLENSRSSRNRHSIYLRQFLHIYHQIASTQMLSIMNAEAAILSSSTPSSPHSSSPSSPSSSSSSSASLFHLERVASADTLSLDSSKSAAVSAFKGLSEFPIPLITSTVKVVLNAEYAIQKNDQPWAKMEEWLVYENGRELARLGNKNFKNSIFFKPLPDAFRYNTSVVNEVIMVKFDICNPLEIPLQLNNLQLLYDHFDIDEELTAAGEPIYNLLYNELKQRPPPVKMEPIDVLLGPNEQRPITFLIQPLREGLLEIRSLVFQLCGGVWGRRDLPLSKKRLNDSKVQRLGKVYEPDLSLSIQICSRMPYLKFDIPDLPSFVLLGEIVKIPITITNLGEEEFKNLKLKVNHPAFFSWPSSALEKIKTADLINPLIQQHLEQLQEEEQYATLSTEHDLSLIHLSDISLLPGESVRRTLFFYAHRLFKQIDLPLLFYYEPAAENKQMKYRLHRHLLKAKIFHSIDARCEIRPSCKSLNTYVLTTSIQNIQNTPIQFKQITSFSGTWKIRPQSYSLDHLPTDTENPESFLIGPRQKLTLHFHCFNSDAKQVASSGLCHCHFPLVTLDPFLSLIFLHLPLLSLTILTELERCQ